MRPAIGTPAARCREDDLPAGQRALQVCGDLALPPLRPYAGRSAPYSLCPTSCARSKSQRRVHGPNPPHPSSRASCTDMAMNLHGAPARASIHCRLRLTCEGDRGDSVQSIPRATRRCFGAIGCKLTQVVERIVHVWFWTATECQGGSLGCLG